jgi:hypothetical protein
MNQFPPSPKVFH